LQALNHWGNACMEGANGTHKGHCIVTQLQGWLAGIKDAQALS